MRLLRKLSKIIGSFLVLKKDYSFFRLHVAYNVLNAWCDVFTYISLIFNIISITAHAFKMVYVSRSKINSVLEYVLMFV